MKLLAVITIGLTGLLVQGASAATSPAPSVVETAFNKVYAPEGFDDNDHVQIVGEGLFPNTCYRPASTKVKVDEVAKTITLSPTAYFYGGICLQVLVPFHQVINLGTLKAGKYKVLTNDARKPALSEVVIEVATSESPDDFLYAPISQAFIKQVGGKNFLTLTGTFSSSCMQLFDVRVKVQSRVIVVQPITRIAGAPCGDTDLPFEKTVEFGSATPGRYLLHVRALNAQAINTLVDIN
jgi:hypothetical protein